MVDTTSAPAPGMSLVARFFGILFSPRETYADVVARPRVLGMMILVLLIAGGSQFWFFSSEVGQQALQAQFEETIRQSRQQGAEIPAENLQAMQWLTGILAYGSAAAQIVFGPIMIALFALIVRAIGNAFLGVEATFKQAYAVMTHSGVITSIGSIFIFGLMYMRRDMNSPTNLGVFFPMLDQTGFPSYLIRTVDLLYVWAFINLAIGIAVMYRRRTGPIATTLLGIYAVVGLLIATVRAL